MIKGIEIMANFWTRMKRDHKAWDFQHFFLLIGEEFPKIYNIV